MKTWAQKSLEDFQNPKCLELGQFLAGAGFAAGKISKEELDSAPVAGELVPGGMKRLTSFPTCCGGLRAGAQQDVPTGGATLGGLLCFVTWAFWISPFLNGLSTHGQGSYKHRALKNNLHLKRPEMKVAGAKVLTFVLHHLPAGGPRWPWATPVYSRPHLPYLQNEGHRLCSFSGQRRRILEVQFWNESLPPSSPGVNKSFRSFDIVYQQPGPCGSKVKQPIRYSWRFKVWWWQPWACEKEEWVSESFVNSRKLRTENQIRNV